MLGFFVTPGVIRIFLGGIPGVRRDFQDYFIEAGDDYIIDVISSGFHPHSVVWSDVLLNSWAGRRGGVMFFQEDQWLCVSFYLVKL